MSLIGGSAPPISAPVSAFGARLLLLVAVLLMPLGMSAAPGAVPAHHGAAAAMPMQHCPDQPPAKSGQPGAPECTMACAGALPAADIGFAAAEPASTLPAQPALVASLSGILLEIATPPPRRA